MYGYLGILHFDVSIGPHVDIYSETHLTVINMMTHSICNCLSIYFKLIKRQEGYLSICALDVDMFKIFAQNGKLIESSQVIMNIFPKN